MLELPARFAETPSTFQILTSEQSAHKAYSAARAAPRVVVTPQVLPGPGFVVGVNYLFQAIYPDGEDLTWAVTRDVNYYPTPGALAAGLPAELQAHTDTNTAEKVMNGVVLKTGKSKVFTFCPTQSGRYTVRLNFSQPDVGFTDTIAVHANATSESVTYHVLVALACIIASATVVAVTAVVCATLLRTKEHAVRSAART